MFCTISCHSLCTICCIFSAQITLQLSQSYSHANFVFRKSTSKCHFFCLCVRPSVVHHILGTVHRLIIIFGTHVENDDTSKYLFHIFKILIFWAAGFDLMTHDSYFLIQVEAFTNHILAENIFHNS